MRNARAPAAPCAAGEAWVAFRPPELGDPRLLLAAACGEPAAMASESERPSMDGFDSCSELGFSAAGEECDDEEEDTSFFSYNSLKLNRPPTTTG